MLTNAVIGGATVWRWVAIFRGLCRAKMVSSFICPILAFLLSGSQCISGQTTASTGELGIDSCSSYITHQCSTVDFGCSSLLRSLRRNRWWPLKWRVIHSTLHNYWLSRILHIYRGTTRFQPKYKREEWTKRYRKHQREKIEVGTI